MNTFRKADLFGRGFLLGQVSCEQTPDGGAVCSDGTFKAPGCPGTDQFVAGAAATGGSRSSVVPAVAVLGAAGVLSYFLFFK